MADEAASKKAITELNGATVENRAISVSVAKQKKTGLLVVVANIITTTEIATIKTVINIFSVEIKEKASHNEAFFFITVPQSPACA